MDVERTLSKTRPMDGSSLLLSTICFFIIHERPVDKKTEDGSSRTGIHPSSSLHSLDSHWLAKKEREKKERKDNASQLLGRHDLCSLDGTALREEKEIGEGTVPS